MEIHSHSFKFSKIKQHHHKIILFISSQPFTPTNSLTRISPHSSYSRNLSWISFKQIKFFNADFKLFIAASVMLWHLSKLQKKLYEILLITWKNKDLAIVKMLISPSLDKNQSFLHLWHVRDYQEYVKSFFGKKLPSKIQNKGL